MGCDDQTALRSARGGGGALGRASMMGSVVWVDFCDGQTITATATNASNQFNEYVLAEDPVFGPGVQDIVIHVDCSNMTPKFQFDVIIQWRDKYGTWKQDVATKLITTQTAADYYVGTPYTTRSSFGRHIRILLRASIQAAGPNPTETATIKAGGAFRMFAS